MLAWIKAVGRQISEGFEALNHSRRMSGRNLIYLFQPRSIALIGASNKPTSVGGVLTRNLIARGFEGAPMLVTPAHAAIAGIATFPDVDSLPQAPDLAVVATTHRRKSSASYDWPRPPTSSRPKPRSPSGQTAKAAAFIRGAATFCARIA